MHLLSNEQLKLTIKIAVFKVITAMMQLNLLRVRNKCQRMHDIAVYCTIDRHDIGALIGREAQWFDASFLRRP